MINYITILLACLWVSLLVYLILNKKIIPINLFGLMLLTSLMQPFLLFYSLTENAFFIETRWENILNRFMFLFTFFALIQQKRYLNRKLNKMSQNEKNLLIPNKE